MNEKMLDAIVEAVNNLCLKKGLPPSVAEITEEAGQESVGSIYYYLRIAAERGRIVHRDRKFMSVDMAQAWPVQEKGK